MNRFAELLDRLAYEPGRNNKLRLIAGYFREVPDPDRGYALAALTGALSFKHAKPGLIRDLIMSRTDPVLFALSHDYVGDFSETVALMWPKAAPSPLPAGESSAQAARLEPGEGLQPSQSSEVPSPALAGSRSTSPLQREVKVGHNNPPPPTLTEVVTTLRSLGK